MDDMYMIIDNNGVVDSGFDTKEEAVSAVIEAQEDKMFSSAGNMRIVLVVADLDDWWHNGGNIHSVDGIRPSTQELRAFLRGKGNTQRGERIKLAKQLWGLLGDVPTNDDEEIDQNFFIWDKGQHRETLWREIEDIFDISVAEDLMGLGDTQ